MAEKKVSKKKVPTPKVEKVEKPVKEKKVKVVIPKYELVSFSIKATIPTQMYGNMMPEIVIKAKTIEDAKAIAMPAIEEIYIKYCEKPRDGSTPAFMSKASVTAEERKVTPTTIAPVAPVAPAPAKLTPQGGTAPSVPVTPPAPAPVAPTAENTEDVAKTPAYEKAEKAISGAMSLDALNLIEDQIQKSVKLTAEEKPMLLTLVLKKRKEF